MLKTEIRRLKNARAKYLADDNSEALKKTV